MYVGKQRPHYSQISNILFGVQLDSNFPSFEDLSFNMDSNKEGEPGRQQSEYGTFDVGSSKEGDGQQFLFGALCGAGDSAGGDDFSFDL